MRGALVSIFATTQTRETFFVCKVCERMVEGTISQLSLTHRGWFVQAVIYNSFRPIGSKPIIIEYEKQYR